MCAVIAILWINHSTRSVKGKHYCLRNEIVAASSAFRSDAVAPIHNFMHSIRFLLH